MLISNLRSFSFSLLEARLVTLIGEHEVDVLSGESHAPHARDLEAVFVDTVDYLAQLAMVCRGKCNNGSF